MWYRHLLRATLFFIILSSALSGYSQQPGSQSGVAHNDSPVKIGVALSGGGAKGFAHIGILKVLEEENIPVHMITGSSMGAVVGSLYAIGYTPEEIRKIALRTDWVKLFDDNYQFNPHNFSNSVSRKDTYLFTFPLHNKKLQLPVALTDGQNVSMMLYRLMLPYHDVEDFSNLPIPFACIATNLETGEPHLFDKGYLPDAVRASFAIPSFFNPVRIENQSYIDGSISRNIPAEDVRRLGADFVISSDVGEPVKPVDSLDTFVHILRQSVGFRQRDSDMKQIALSDIYIQPDIKGFSSFSYDKISQIISRGEEAARKAVPAIREYLDVLNPASSVEKSFPANQNNNLLISEVTFNNIEERLARQARLILDVLPPSQMTVSDIEQKVKLLYSSGLFSQVSYRLKSNSGYDGKTLAVTFQPKKQEYAGFSMRYDSRYKASLLFDVSLNDHLFWNDQIDGRLRIGEILEGSVNYSAPVSLAPLSRFSLGLGVQRSPIDYYVDGNAISTIGFERLNLGSSLSLNFLNDLQLQTGVKTEFYNLNEAVGNTLVLENTHFLLTGFGEIAYHTLNRPYFPTQGQQFKAHAALSNTMWGSSANFFQLSGSWFGTLKLTQNLNLGSKIIAGYTSPESSLPLHYHFYLGGLTNNPVFSWHQFAFLGYDNQQLRSTNMIALQPQLQLQLSDKIFAIGSWNVAHLSDHWTFGIRNSRLWQGFSLSAAALTIIGPVELSLATPDLRGGYTVKINVGYSF